VSCLKKLVIATIFVSYMFLFKLMACTHLALSFTQPDLIDHPEV